MDFKSKTLPFFTEIFDLFSATIFDDCRNVHYLHSNIQSPNYSSPKMKSPIVLILFLLSFINVYSQEVQTFSERPIFINGEEGYECYRIPAIIKNGNGDLLAFAEGRTNGCNDFGNLDIVLKTSTNNGKSWSPLQIVVNNGDFQAGNPAPVLDMLDPDFPNGRIFLLFNTGNNHEAEVRKGNGIREVWYVTSADQGKKWSRITNISDQVHPFRKIENVNGDSQMLWRSYANTPGHAIQLKQGKYKGRLFIPANHSMGNPIEGFNEYRAHAYYSDDHGKSWKLSENVKVPSSNESIAVELGEGMIMQNIREQSGLNKKRLVAMSSDGGETWDSTYFDQTLIDPVCQASMMDFQLPNGQKAILFSNPASDNSRTNMTVRMSLNQGMSWPVSRIVNEASSAYSDLVVQKDGQIGLLYERGNGGGIHYANFNLPWLLNGREIDAAGRN